jgi:Protein of unknown function (DUF3095)
MEPIKNDLFYSRLPVNEISLSDLLTEDHLFYKMPANWHVVITDVKNSTAAVEGGLHETINLIATASIVAVLNITYKANLTIPFFFGGDGATFIIPPTPLENVMRALQKHRDNTKTNFNLDLRIGQLPVAEIYERGHDLRISKLRTSKFFSIPVLMGDGLMYAEKKIKGPDYLLAPFSVTEDVLDLTGMQCRWDRIKPPKNIYEVVSLLAIARGSVNQSLAFKKVIDCVDAIYGTVQNRTPITVEKLRLKSTLAKIGLEVRTRMGGFNIFNFVNTWIRTNMGYFYFKTRKGKVYLHNLVSMSDTLVIDGRINTVISGTAEQREMLVNELNKLEAEGEILYGLYVSKESVMSCYVRNLNDTHIHFIDGAEGGYTKAAGVIKKKNIKG